MNIIISELNKDDRKQWEQLYYQYADFYNMPMDRKILDTIWAWIFDQHNPFFALIAKNDKGDLVGFMHCREMPSPLRGSVVGFLDDLYIIPKYRGTGCVQKMYQSLNIFGKNKGWAFIRWITAEDNYKARSSYDKIAKKTHWQTYQMTVE